MNAPIDSRWHAATFRAMATNCRIVTANAESTHLGVMLVAELEQRWSRFRPDSEVSELNRSSGQLCVVSESTFELVARAEQARVATAGRFNPLMLDHLTALGYDATWDEVRLRPESSARVGFVVPACVDAIELFPDLSAVRLPNGTRFDPGGIGKGLAGDLVAEALLDDGVGSMQIELGGDVRVAGVPWVGEQWQVRVDDVDHGAPTAAVVSLPEGGVATSSVVRRRWRRGGVDVHHLIDPTTGLSAHTDLDAVTAVAPTLWWAEVVAKVALMAGAVGARSLLQRHDMSGLLVPAESSNAYEVVARRKVAA